jgi:hypothetical protein
MTSLPHKFVIGFSLLTLLGCAEKNPGATVNPVDNRDPGSSKPDAKAPPPKDAKPAPTMDADPPKPEGDTAPPTSSTSDASTDVTASDVTPAADTLPAQDSTASAADAGSGSDAAAVGPANEAKWSHTACDKKALMFPKIDKNNGVFPIGSCPPPEDLNRACGNGSKIKVAKATAMTFETGYFHPPEYAIDEYIMTRWSSNSMPMSWIMLDLGSEQSFKRIYLAWEIAHASDYDLETSNDGTSWTMLKQVRGGDGFQDILDVDGKARYVRLTGIKRGEIGEGPYGYSLFDFTLCGERP